MNRRGFFKALAAAAVGAAATHVLDPEKLLWVPGQKTHFIAPAAGWHQAPLWRVGFDHGVRDAQVLMTMRQNEVLQVIELSSKDIFTASDIELDRLAQDARYKHIIDDAVKQLAAEIDSNLFKVVYEEMGALPPLTWANVGAAYGALGPILPKTTGLLGGIKA